MCACRDQRIIYETRSTTGILGIELRQSSLVANAINQWNISLAFCLFLKYGLIYPRLPSTWHTTRDDLKFLISLPLTPWLLQQVWTNMPYLYSSRNQTQGLIHAGQALYLLPSEFWPQPSGCRSVTASKLKPIQHITWPHHTLSPHQKTNSWGTGGWKLVTGCDFWDTQ